MYVWLFGCFSIGMYLMISTLSSFHTLPYGAVTMSHECLPKVPTLTSDSYMPAPSGIKTVRLDLLSF